MIILRAPRPDEGPALAAMARTSFTETFGHLYRPEDLAAFLAEAFGDGGLPAHIGDPAYAIRIALDGERIAGFAKTGRCALPAPADPAAMELKQLYVLRPWHGSGVAAELMAWALDQARAAGAPSLALSVWSENLRAQRFYARHGLAKIGDCTFRVGEQLDRDEIWSVTL